jgi:chromosome segregation ATPase
VQEAKAEVASIEKKANKLEARLEELKSLAASAKQIKVEFEARVAEAVTEAESKVREELEKTKGEALDEMQSEIDAAKEQFDASEAKIEKLKQRTRDFVERSKAESKQVTTPA